MSEQIRDVEGLLAQRAPVEMAMLNTAHAVVRRHRLMGLPLAIWRDGAVAWVSADDIVLPDDVAADDGAKGDNALRGNGSSP